MNLIRIGEGARLLSPGVLAATPDVPWPKVKTMRNYIAHNYAQVSADILWDAAARGVPDLARNLRAYIERP